MSTSRLSKTSSQSFTRATSLTNCSLVLAALLLVSPVLCIGQTARPALLPETGGRPGGTSAESAALAGSIGSLTDEPISAGETVHVIVFDAPEFSSITRVSESGDIAFPVLGVVHIGGLSSQTAADLIATKLKNGNLMLDPHVTVTVDSTSTGITVLGEVRAPGIYPPPGNHMLSDLLATAGGLTANTGRVIEISNHRTPDQKTYLPWDPTMHNTSNYDRAVGPGDRVLVRACGIAYIGGRVLKPGAYSLCGSPQITLSEVVSLAGGIGPLSSEKHTYLIRTQPDGTRVAQQIDLHKVLTAKLADPVVKEDDIIFVSPSAIKDALTRASGYALALASPLVFAFH